MFSDQVMKKKSTSTDFSLALNEINNVYREIRIKRICERIDKTMYN